MVRVVMSSATRVPCLSFALSTFDRQPTTYLGPEEALTITVAWQVSDSYQITGGGRKTYTSHRPVA